MSRYSAAPGAVHRREFRRLSAGLELVVSAYVRSYPHLTTLAQNATISEVALRDFARSACRLAVPPDAPSVEVFRLTQIAGGWR